MLLNDISATEHELVKEAKQQYGEYFDHAQYAVDFLHNSIKSTKHEGVFFLMFFAMVEKHIALAAISAVRLHHVQANFNLRYATEAGSWAAYALANPDPSLYALVTEDNALEPTNVLKMKMYTWLETQYPAGSDSLKRFKGSTNRTSTHANIVEAHRNFSGFEREKISTSFFDESTHNHIKTDLWASANLSMGLLDLFYGVNRDYPHLILHDDFLSRMNVLRDNDKRLKEEMLKQLTKPKL